MAVNFKVYVTLLDEENYVLQCMMYNLLNPIQRKTNR